MVRRLWIFAAALTSCRTTPTVVETPPTTAPAIVTLPTPVAPLPREPEPEPEPTPAPTGPDVPPSAIYEAAVRVLHDDCAPAYVVPQPWRRRLFGKARRNRAGELEAFLDIKAEYFPGSTQQYNAGNRYSLLVVPQRPPVTSHPRGCVPTTQITAISAVSRQGFTMTSETQFGDGTACGVTNPKNCSVKLEFTYRVAELECPAECFKGTRPDPKADRSIAMMRTVQDLEEVVCECPATPTPYCLVDDAIAGHDPPPAG